MRKRSPKVQLEHAVFGKVFVTSAGRADSGHYLICRNYESRMAPAGAWERKLLVDGPWLTPQEKVRAAFDTIYAPIYERGLKQLRRGEWIHAMNYQRINPVRSTESSRKVDETLERVTPENAEVVASEERLAEIEEIATLEETADLMAVVLSTRGPLRLPQRRMVVA
jgi:hypothetical protein